MVTAESKKTVLLLNDQLNRDYGALKKADPKSRQILFIESERMLTTRSWHVQRLFFLMSARDHFLQELRDQGFTVTFIQSSNTEAGINEFHATHPGVEIEVTEPSSHQQFAQLKGLGLTLIPNDFFLTSRHSCLSLQIPARQR